MPSGVNTPLMPYGTRNRRTIRSAHRGRQRDARDRRRQGERQIDHGVDDAAAGKVISHEHPRDDDSEHSR